MCKNEKQINILKNIFPLIKRVNLHDGSDFNFFTVLIQ